MTTARDIIRRAMMQAGILTKTETPSADEANDGMATMNAMISSWSNESLLCVARAWENFTLSGGDGEYTIGTGADFDTSRPIKVVEAHVRDGSVDLPVAIIDDVMYNQYITQKNISGIPYWLNYDNGFPQAKIRLWPVPSTAYVLYLLSEKPLTEFDLDDDVSYPPGWEAAIVYNLAVWLAPQYGQEPDQILMKMANDTKGSIKLAIMKTRMMDAAPMTAGIRNIYTGWEN